MNILLALYVIFQVLVGFNLVFPLGLLGLSAVLKTVGKKEKGHAPESRQAEPDYAIVITAYGQADTVPAALESVKRLQYEHYLVYVVADHCDVPELREKDDRVIILRPEKVLANNVKSHFYAIERFRRRHDRLVIVDSDNLVHPGLLRALNQWFERGYRAVQGVREAKNLDTVFACLDAARDIYYHFYDGKALFGAGSSATLSGSGMAFDVALYRECLGGKEVPGAGFDKVLQAEIVSRDLRIAYAPEAIVYDEKTAAGAQLVKQRARWINTWFRYFKLGFGIAGQGVRNASSNQLLFGLVLLRPPLFIFLLLSLGFTILNLVFFPAAGYAWLAGLFCFVMGFAIAMARSSADPRIIRSLYAIPSFVYYQVRALLKTGRAGKLSVATREGAADLNHNSENP
ncbi:hypothetical protein GCM10023091_32700 [Ravibacter arvi]|uniref:Cellulose synthase/poly-beta-1,6-N-acetylglucosamine synthase-like glycosyltransferase n=1 Tax=Ravibacter arvi TaxID=2051041 RepID=A0ABP8M5A5_9BACT